MPAIHDAPDELGLALLSQGWHERLWELLGAHPAAEGTSFAVWAPAAREVRVAGVEAGWGGPGGVPMARAGRSGVWHAFVPGARPGDRYRYRVHGADGIWRDKADPVAFAAECPPGTASVIFSSRHPWGDADWMRGRTGAAHARPMSVYEVHLGSWRPGLGYADLAHELADHVTGLGFTHVEVMPVMEHPYGGSWGYQVSGYYAPTARFGTPDEFRYFVDHLHRRGVGVILDWVPAHFPRDGFALARFDGTSLYGHPDPRRGEHPDWGTLIFDFSRPEVRNFLIANALYWCQEFHVDGLRVDAVASMLYLDYSRDSGQWEPNRDGGNEDLDGVAFLRQLTSTVHRVCPGVTMIAEDSSTRPGTTRPVADGGLGFDLKWNLGWMHDTLAYLARDPAHRRPRTLAEPGGYAFDEHWVLPLSHDEVVHGKGSLAGKLRGDRLDRLAGLRGLLGYMWAFPGKPLVFMGTELAPEAEWSEQHGLDWSAASGFGAGVARLITDLNRAYRDDPALWSLDATPDGFDYLATDRDLVALLRRGADGSLVASITNFSGTGLVDYRLGLPHPGRWVEVINTDAFEYAGSGVRNPGGVVATGARPSARVRVGPYATVWLRYAGIG
jgi:1,4-alpha-glucan branching enzyme